MSLFFQSDFFSLLLYMSQNIIVFKHIVPCSCSSSQRFTFILFDVAFIQKIEILSNKSVFIVDFTDSTLILLEFS